MSVRKHVHRIRESKTFLKEKRRAEFWKERYFDLLEQTEIDRSKVVRHPIYELGWRDGNRARRIRDGQ